ncbi:nuclease domain-containing protein 1 [Ascoidea rubescens DSM 1968]|uniref:Nuclease domain-containing protein 1 n=1 Tax=Ascoidea rubescens DSM 1968 TaxID=1344418 RepID=A0A1D2VP86_9ASCO|nr:nuclease domain-containing protein 1 [Ascoidea rubescens DSM 1968]ODV63421.1 nuclease domain-containing protein 1 [Ascoidea rubescens DSM 1968]
MSQNNNKVFSAKVKNVLSGDTLILVPTNHKGTSPPPERQLSLAYLQAPRLNLNEVYSFESRELLRNLLLGKVVQFKVLYTLPALNNSKREFGDVKTPIFNSLIEYVLAKGTAKVRENAESHNEDYYYDLKDLEDKAKKDKIGLWVHTTPLQLENELLYNEIEQSKKTPYDAIVERVISGDRLLVRILLSKKNHAVLPVLIGGVRSPRTASLEDEKAEPYGNEAKLFVEQRLISRMVKLSVIGSSSNGVPIAKIIHPAGDIAEKILEAGLAEIVDWQSTMIGSSRMSILRTCERSAKVSNKGLWKNTNTRSIALSDSKNLIKPGKKLNATVTRIISADTLSIRINNDSEDKEYTVQLSSLRGPKQSDANQTNFIPFAKEFVRKLTIGKKITVQIDGIRPKNEQFPERPLVSVTLPNGEDLSKAIVTNGWAQVIRHRRGDDDRSPNWDELIEIEAEVIKAKKGMHGKLPRVERIVDASENAGRAKTYLQTLQNRTKISAVVDYVSSPNRFRLILPKEGYKLVLVLGGLTNTLTGSKDSELNKAALDFVNKKSLQRDVHIEIYNVDRIGSFIGNLFLPGQNLPLQINLLKQGFYKIHENSVNQIKFADQMWEAQESAQEQKIGIWKNYVPEDGEQEYSKNSLVKDITDKTENLKLVNKYHDIEVTDVSDEGLISFQFLNAETDKLIPFMKEFHEFHNNQPIKAVKVTVPGAIPAYPSLLPRLPRKGDYVSAEFSSNGKFYRAKVLSYDKTTRKCKVQHIDFGNTDQVPTSSIRELPPQFSLAKLGAQGHVGLLSLIKLPPSKPTDYLTDAIYFLEDLIAGKKLIACENKSNPTPGVEMSITLYDPEKIEKDVTYSINRELVENGWAIVNKKLKGFEVAMKDEWKTLIKLEQQAKLDRKGCWEFGDIEGDEE